MRTRPAGGDAEAAAAAEAEAAEADAEEALPRESCMGCSARCRTHLRRRTASMAALRAWYGPGKSIAYSHLRKAEKQKKKKASYT
jgi:hypothetical protein